MQTSGDLSEKNTATSKYCPGTSFQHSQFFLLKFCSFVETFLCCKAQERKQHKRWPVSLSTLTAFQGIIEYVYYMKLKCETHMRNTTVAAYVECFKSDQKDPNYKTWFEHEFIRNLSIILILTLIVEICIVHFYCQLDWLFVQGSTWDRPEQAPASPWSYTGQVLWKMHGWTVTLRNKEWSIEDLSVMFDPEFVIVFGVELFSLNLGLNCSLKLRSI